MSSPKRALLLLAAAVPFAELFFTAENESNARVWENDRFFLRALFASWEGNRVVVPGVRFRPRHGCHIRKQNIKRETRLKYFEELVGTVSVSVRYLPMWAARRKRS